jgi:hypothetical protein
VNARERDQEESSGSNTGGGNTQEAEAYVSKKCIEYRRGEYVDEAMFYRLQEDFEEWSDNQLATIQKSTLYKLRDVVRLYSVYVTLSRDVKQDIIQTVRQEERVI